MTGDASATPPVWRVRPEETIIDLRPIDRTQVVEGLPRAGWRMLGSIPGIDVGVWEHTPGISTDVEEDEVFLVLSGRATVSVDDGESIEFSAGDVGILRAGAITTWVVHETLRKVFIGRTGGHPAKHVI